MTETLLLIMIVGFCMQFCSFFVAASWFARIKKVFDEVLQCASDAADAAPELPAQEDPNV